MIDLTELYQDQFNTHYHQRDDLGLLDSVGFAFTECLRQAGESSFFIQDKSFTITVDYVKPATPANVGQALLDMIQPRLEELVKLYCTQENPPTLLSLANYYKITVEEVYEIVDRSKRLHANSSQDNAKVYYMGAGLDHKLERIVAYVKTLSHSPSIRELAKRFGMRQAVMIDTLNQSPQLQVKTAVMLDNGSVITYKKRGDYVVELTGGKDE